MSDMTVLVAGGSGLLGSRIAHALLEQPDAEVRLLVREGWQHDPRRRARVQPLIDAGATARIGDVGDPGRLDRATDGVDVVISSLQGGADVMVDGQVALAEAAVRNGARRFIPSDFAIDLFSAPAGPPQFEVRKRADALIGRLDIEVLHVLQGAFLDQMVDPSRPGLLDLAARQVRYWGTGDEVFDMTTVEDTARFTARLSTDVDAAPGVHAISGGRVSFNGLARRIHDITGIELQPVVWGDQEELRARIAAKGGSWDAVMEWYLLAMLTTPPLEHLDNDRYPDARPTSVDDHLIRVLGEAGLARRSVRP